MTIRQALGVVVLVLMACGPGGDSPTAAPATPASPAQQDSKAAEKDPTTIRDHFVWEDASQPARDWDVDAEACQGNVSEDPSIGEGAPPLTRLAAFAQCMKEKGWAVKVENP